MHNVIKDNTEVNYINFNKVYTLNLFAILDYTRSINEFYLLKLIYIKIYLLRRYSY